MDSYVRNEYTGKKAEIPKIHPDVLEERPPAFLVGIFSETVAFIEQNGWCLLGILVLGTYVWTKLRHYFYSWLEYKEEREFSARYHKNPDLLEARLRAQEEARQRMQEKYEKDAKDAAEKRKELEEKKQLERLAKLEGLDVGQRLGDSSSDESGSKKPSKSKPDYNPLMGSGSSNYRPPRRSCCPSSGCG